MTATHVIKRQGFRQAIDRNKIIKRILFMVETPFKLSGIDVANLANKVANELRQDMTTQEIDEYTSEYAASLIIRHLDYGILAGRIAINNHHKKTKNSFRDKVDELYMHKDTHNNASPLVSDTFYKFVIKNQKIIEETIDSDLDYLIDYFGFKTLEKNYLLRIGKRIIERPQDMWMRVAIAIHMTDDYYDKGVMAKIIETYRLLSTKKICQASPTLFNAGTNYQQMISCMLLGTGDSEEMINKTFCDMSRISKRAGGIGVHVSSIRAKGSIIRSTNGPAAGIVAVARIFNAAMLMYNQGGRRPGNAALFIEPHHPDIIDFLNLKRHMGDDNSRARDLFYAVWVSDLFMKRAEAGQQWSLFCPDECPGLNDVWGDEYEALYTRYENEGRARKTLPAREILIAMYESMADTGVPYVSFKDTINRHNMQSNIGIIRSSNLCNEIVLYSDANEYAVCCLGNIVLPNYVYDSWTDAELALPENDRRKLDHEFPENPYINWEELVNNARVLTRNLDAILDKNCYPVIETARSAFKSRAIGIGVQGLADVFMKFRAPFESAMAKDLDAKIFEAIYYGCLSESAELCREIYFRLKRAIRANGYVDYSPYSKTVLGQYPKLQNELLYKKYTKRYDNTEKLLKTVGTYPMYLENGGSPLANGKFHWELYNRNGSSDVKASKLFDWDSLRGKIKEYGVRHSHVMAAMPTASTSQIMGNIESFEPYKSNMYRRKTSAGEFTIMNKYLQRDLHKSSVDLEKAKQHMMVYSGSIQGMERVSARIKALHKTAFEIKQKEIMNHAICRQPFIDQSQSMNLFFQVFTFDKFFNGLMYAWKNALKTGVYYTRTRPAVGAQNLTIDPNIEQAIRESKAITFQGDEEICAACQ